MSKNTTHNAKCVFVYEADHLDNIIYVDVDSMKRAGQITSPEFAEFMKIKNTLPGYTIKTKEFPKKNKRTYGGLTIKVMQAFIIQHENDPKKREDALRVLNKKKAEGLVKGATYGVVKSWFIDEYGEVYNGSALSKKDSKRDAHINELLASVDQKLIAPVAAIQKEGVASNG